MNCVRMCSFRAFALSCEQAVSLVVLARELDAHGRGWDCVGKVKNVSANHVGV